jgi:hypothetical protein
VKRTVELIYYELGDKIHQIGPEDTVGSGSVGEDSLSPPCDEDELEYS